MTCPEFSYKTKLRSLISAAESLKRPAYAALCKAGNPPQISRFEVNDLVTTIPDLLLPLPCSIQPALIKAGCSLELAQSLSDAYMRSAQQIRAMYQSTYIQTCKSLATEITSETGRLSRRLKRIRSAFEHQYEVRIQAVENLAVDSSQRAHRPSRPKPSFNQDFVPLLEKYFEYNAYPSASDRVILARKSMMTLRQIEVWFQNHRNRAKKVGLPLRRLTIDPLPLSLPFEPLNKIISCSDVFEGKMSSLKSAKKSKDSPVNESGDKKFSTPTEIITSELNSVSPPHAFPSVYPPSCGYNPFPIIGQEKRFAIPIWRRTPASQRPTYTTVNIDDLILDFATKLTIQGPAQRRKNDSPSSTFSGHSWSATLYTVVSSAPHPALLPSYTHDPMVSGLRPGPPHAATPVLYQKQFHPPDPLSPLMNGFTLAGGRNPPNSNLAHRGASPTMSDAPSPPRFLFSSPRSSSFSSESSGTCQSSLRSSPMSSTVTTPVSSPLPLPESPSFRLNSSR